MVARPSPGRSTVPLTIEPVIGWRMWCVDWDGESGVQLTSPLQTYEWRPLQPNRARCHTHFGRQVPNPSCGCGLYAVSHLGTLAGAMGLTARLQVGVVGSVAMWGRVVEHSAGYRGQLAYPDRIRLVCRRCLSVGRDGVPTQIERGDGGRVQPVCHAHSSPGRPMAGITPDRLQQMLLSAYAVDLLPVETLHEAGYRPGPISPTRLIPAARAEARQLSRRPSGGLVFALLVGAFLALRAINPSTPPEPKVPEAVPPSLDPAPAPVVDEVVPHPRVEVAPPDRGQRVPRFGLLCGRRIGITIELMDCDRWRAKLLGFYTSPPEPRGDCLPGDGYTRKLRFSVCWFSFYEALESLGRLQLPGVHLWDLAG